MNWQTKVKIKHLLNNKEDWASVSNNMAKVANALSDYPCFSTFDKSRFYEIPHGDGVITPTDYANKLLDNMYNYADAHRIWIE